MAKVNQQTTDTSDREIVISRILNAPRELVWEAWTDPKHLIQWWGPNGFTNTFEEIAVKPGGKWRFIMHGPDGVDYPNLIVYKEVVKPERLAYNHGSTEENGQGSFKVVITFKEVDNGKKTELTMYSIFSSKEERDLVVEKYGALEGGNQTLDKLEKQLEKMSVAK